MTPFIKSTLQNTNIKCGRVVDLFAGIGSVTASLANVYPVIANDTLQFTNCIARALFTKSGEKPDAAEMLTHIHPLYTDAYKQLERKHAKRLYREKNVIASAGWIELCQYMEDSNHPGNSAAIRNKASAARDASDYRAYQLAELYFSASYFSLRQSLQIDAIRYAIDTLYKDNDVATAMWLGAVSDVANATGHTAQFLKAHDDKSSSRIRQYWKKDVWTQFENRMNKFQKAGSRQWRSQNSVSNLEARQALTLNADYRIVYADPPYTKDQYSRYYHVYETLFLNDYPTITALGRYRSDRFISDFSVKSKVVSAFDGLLEATSTNNASLIVSYPSTGLLHRTDASLEDMIKQYFPKLDTIVLPAMHSTLGARSGSPKKAALECIYVCTY